MEREIFLEIKFDPERKRRAEYILWTEHPRKGTIDFCRRGEIVTDRLDPDIRSRLSALAIFIGDRNSEREGNRISGTFGISDKEYLKKRRRAEAEDAIAAREKADELEEADDE